MAAGPNELMHNGLIDGLTIATFKYLKIQSRLVFLLLGTPITGVDLIRGKSAPPQHKNRFLYNNSATGTQAMAVPRRIEIRRVGRYLPIQSITAQG